MGKTSRKVKKQVQKKSAVQRLQQCQPKEMELELAFERGEYAEVLNILAELIAAKDIKPEFLYKGAYSYFMLGDYERAAQWVNNTLNYAPNHVDARILLARLCFMQNRDDDGLAIYEFLVEHYRSSMTEEQKDQIIDSSEYYVRRESEKLQQKYPHLAEFLQLGRPAEKVEEVLPTSEASPTEGETTLSALQRLKDKLKAIQAKENGAAEPEAKIDEAAAADKADEAERQINEIEGRTCSLREKVKLFNQFAAAQYVDGHYQQAEKLLKAALLKDEEDSQTLRNMAMVQAALGCLDKAQAFATKLPEVDFCLLYMLKEQSNG